MSSGVSRRLASGGKWQVASGRWQVAGFTLHVLRFTFHVSRFTFHIILLILLTATFLAACKPAILETPPRLATATAEQATLPTATPTPLLSAAPTPTGTAAAWDAGQSEDSGRPNAALTLWVNETSAAHAEALASLAERFEQRHGLQVEWVMVAPELLPGLAQTAVLSGTLPDLIIHPVEYTIGWAERGILDVEAASEAIDQLGRDTFDPGALALVEQDGGNAAIPSDGWQQLVIYRTDWFAQKELAAPVNYTTLLTAAATLSDTANLVSGFVVPTESDLVSTQQVFEFLATANGCPLVNDQGEVLFVHPACLEALDFYRDIINGYSPIGVQTDLSALNAYLAGRTGLIMASPSALPAIAGLDDEARPSCPECSTDDYLAQNSGFITEIQGGGQFSTTTRFGEVTYLGITRAADRQAALTFAQFWFDEGYLDWLGVEPERKVPMRWGTAENPRHFLEAWPELPLAGSDRTLGDLFGPELVSQLSNSITQSRRWGLAQGQGALITALYENLTLSLLLQEMLSGYFNTSQSIVEAYLRIVDLIPNYTFPLAVQPTPTPTPFIRR
ncbi:MAG: extracellular solute-binding protein [Chloroflexota bacterium]